MKAGFYWSYPSRSLARGGQRTLLAIFCIAVGVLAIVALQLVGNMVNDGLTSNIRAGNGGDISVRSDIVPLTAEQVTTFDTLKSQNEITQYTAVAESQAQSIDNDGQFQFYNLAAVDPQVFPLAGVPTFTNPPNGSLASLLTGNNLVVTQSLLMTLGAQVGDTITIHAGDGRVVTGTIVGVIENGGLFQGDEALVSLNSYKALPGASNQPVSYNAIYADVPDHSDENADAAKQSIQSALPLATVTTTKDALQQNEDQVQLIRYFLQVVGLLALLIGGVGIINTMQVLLRRRQTEIAMLKTAGYQRRDLYLLFGVEAGLLGIAGGIVGAAAGVGVSFLVKSLVEQLFSIALPGSIDPVTVVSGVAIGFFTALIFGLLPIVQASQIRPVEVLRGIAERRGGTGIAVSILLAVLLAVLFFFLALSILKSVGVALGLVAGAGIFLLLLSLAFTLIAFIIGKLPVPERFSLWFVLLIGGALLISAAITLAIPAFGVLFLVVSLLGLVVVILPRTWKSNVKMALRNIGRQKIRTSTTMVALFVGVFAIGLILTLGQNIKDEINSALSTQLKYNSFLLVGSADKAAVDQKLAQISEIQGQTVNAVAQDIPLAVNNVDIGTFLQGVSDAGSSSSVGRQGAIFFLSGVTGYDLAQGTVPDTKIVKGFQASQVGRNLIAQDASPNPDGSYNVLMPQAASLGPLNLKLDDLVKVGSRDGKTTATLKVVGFYPTSFTGTNLPIYGANSLVNTLSGGNPLYVYSLKLDPNQAHDTLQQIQKAVPSVQTFSVVDLLVFINGLLNNLIILLTAIASLAMLAGIIIIANAVALAMLERRRELGILKSVGYTSRSVLSEVLMENGVVGFTGALLAMLLVTLATVVLAKVVFKITLGVSAPIVLGIVLATAVICMLVAWLVAWNATRVRPLEVLRYE
ncbi:MAG TPA: FtsX-like permease family protein [Ktedonobacterales bacterium]|jgi:predicted lysophospholipase L1 biosynthesis ABC-type transport system permease subunit